VFSYKNEKKKLKGTGTDTFFPSFFIPRSGTTTSFNEDPELPVQLVLGHTGTGTDRT
jgi:hypothetical protein